MRILENIEHNNYSNEKRLSKDYAKEVESKRKIELIVSHIPKKAQKGAGQPISASIGACKLPTTQRIIISTTPTGPPRRLWVQICLNERTVTKTVQILHR